MKSTMQSTPLLISTLLRYGTRVHGDSEVATWTPDGARRTTYRELGDLAGRLANALRSLGVTGDQRVATFMWNNTEHLMAYLAVPSMGAVLHALNIRLFPEQLVYVARHGGSEVVIVDNTLAAPFARLLPHLPAMRHVIVNGPVDDDTRAALGEPEHIEQVHDLETLLAAHEPGFDWPEDLDENDATSMCYTSGTTGHPKGVAYSHRSNVLHAMGVAASLGVRQPDRLLIVVPLFHANAWGFPYAAMVTGCSLVMPDRFLQAEPLTAMIAAEGVTGGAGVPTIWNDLLHYLDTHEADVSSVHMLMVGGSAAPPALIRRFQEEHDIEIVHGWGMTEMSPVGSLAIPPGAAEPASDAYWAYRQAQGRLLCGVEGRIIGPDGSEQPWDGRSVGELEVRGPWITGSYYSNGSESSGEIDEMAAKFDDGWLRTGDVGTLTHDGFLVLTDRAKDVIKSGGEWISSVDLENAIMAHPDVLEASVVGVPDEKWGERPLASVVLKEGATTTVEDLRAFLEEKVAHWQVPERWALIDEVPKTSVGKFDKKVLRRRYAAGELEVRRVEPTTT
ncbi:long-chain fatty acid--CoA ligase [Intrasporangium oryzae NRRL B-24470]|uniref:Long-chain fatty acid--CoA ligase n=1 Tax=Intrasporangium oryzae NRRL B-24470 TaxID=1386089 RepID=W9GCA8_9MICO|nr:long-chain fatty acid--CoA ligase [Intrasporangium oryzae]EWT01479.1 long-chain fatty acid--CoA ligase [Intrasporangium oryzae NRRL B-24470]